MVNVSNAYKEAIKENRVFHHKLDITFQDGFKTTVEDLDIYTFQITQGTSGTNSFDIGAAVASQLTVKLNNADGIFDSHDFDEAEISAKVGLELADGSIEWVDKGRYTAEPGEDSGSSISVNTFDNMVKFDKEYSVSDLAYPATLGSIVRDACSCCGVSLAADAARFDNDNIIVRDRPEDTTTFRQVLQWVGQIACKYSKINADGELTMQWYDTDLLENTDAESEKEILGLHQIKQLQSGSTVQTEDVVITGIKVIEETEDGDATYQSGTAGYMLKISENKLIQAGNGAAVAEYLGNQLNGLRFCPLSINVQCDPAREAGDIGIITDRKGNAHKTIFTSVTYTAHASQKMDCAAEKATRLSASRYSKTTQVYKELRSKLRSQKKEWEKAFESLQNAMESKNGLYPSIEEQEDKSYILYLHDKPTLEESMVVIKLSAAGWGMSSDGGKTWNIGALVDGTMITQILTAIGVNADWINAGNVSGKFIDAKGLRVTDKDKSQTLYIDDDGNVYVNAASLLLGGKSVGDMVLEEVNKLPKETNNLLKGWALSENDIEIYWDTSGTPMCGNTADPTGGTNALRISGIKSNSTVLAAKKTTNVIGNTAGRYNISFWLRALNTSVINEQEFEVYFAGNLVATIYSGTSKMKRYNFSVDVTSFDSSATYNFEIRAKAAIGGNQTFCIYRPEITFGYTSKDVFNMLTNNGALKGLYMVGDQLYFSFDFAQGGTLKLGGKNNGNGLLVIVDENDNEVGYIDNTGVHFNQGSFSGKIESGEGLLAGWKIVEDRLESPDGNVALYSSGKIKIGNTVLTPVNKGIAVKYGLQIYTERTSGDEFTDFTGEFKIYNLAPRTGGRTMMHSDSTVGYIASSSKRYKDHKGNITEEEALRLLDLPAIWFKYKDNYLTAEDPMNGKKMPGFYAEDVADTLPELAIYDEEDPEKVEDWNYRTMIPMMLKLIQVQEKRIKSLESMVQQNSVTGE